MVKILSRLEKMEKIIEEQNQKIHRLESYGHPSNTLTKRQFQGRNLSRLMLRMFVKIVYKFSVSVIVNTLILVLVINIIISSIRYFHLI